MEPIPVNLTLIWTFKPEFWGQTGSYFHLRVEISSEEYPHRSYFEDYSADLNNQGNERVAIQAIRDMPRLAQRYEQEVPGQEAISQIHRMVIREQEAKLR